MNIISKSKKVALDNNPNGVAQQPVRSFTANGIWKKQKFNQRMAYTGAENFKGDLRKAWSGNGRRNARSGQDSYT